MTIVAASETPWGLVRGNGCMARDSALYRDRDGVQP
jgi:hypothetical protein